MDHYVVYQITVVYQSLVIHLLPRALVNIWTATFCSRGQMPFTRIMARWVCQSLQQLLTPHFWKDVTPVQNVRWVNICSCCTDRHAHNTHIHTHPHSYGSHKHTHSYTSHKHTHTSYKLTHAHSYYFTNTQTQPHLCTSHKQLK